MLLGEVSADAPGQAMSLEQRAILEGELGSRDTSAYRRRSEDFDSPGRNDIADDLACDRYQGGVNLSGNNSRLGNRENVLRIDLAVDLPLNLRRTAERDFSGDIRSVIEIGSSLRRSWP